MKRFGLIAGLIACAITAVAVVVRDFIVDDPVAYFRRQPSQLLYVMGIAVAGGLLTLGFQSLPTRAKRVALVWVIGVVSTITTAAFGYFTYILFSLASMISKFGGSIWYAVAMCLPTLLFLTAIAAYSWFTFWRLWRKESAQ